ncbi:MAG: acetylxylan esterase, partial [Bacteroidales bacterium]|nr:acetylxylan esterase [Bacteroidales bacterium]
MLTACLLFITTINAFAQKQDTIAGIPVNYDESKTGSWELPDLFTLQSGSRVTNAKDWMEQRRPEIARLFASEQFGKSPRRIPRQANLFDAGSPALEGKALRKQVRLYFTDDTARHQADMVIYLPAEATGPVPLF